MTSSLLLTEGGLAGHMSHLYEDPDLTFGRIKQVFQDTAEGRLEGTVKLDGQNIYISYSAKSNEARATRNKEQIRAGGVDAAGLARFFQGRDTLETAFVESFESFENVAKSLPDDALTAIFGEDANIFYNAEVIDPRNVNVIHYKEPFLVIQQTGHAHIDKETGVISDIDVSENVDALRSSLEKYQEAVVLQKFKVQLNAVATLKAMVDDVPVKGAIQALDDELLTYGLGDGNTIGEYLVKKILLVIENNVPDLPVENKKLLAKRIVGLKSATMTLVKKGLNPEQKQYLKSFIPTGKVGTKAIATIKKQAIGPIELIIHEFAIQALKGLESAFILDQNTEVERLRALISSAINMVKSETVKQHYPQALDILERELSKLGKAGVEGIFTASEGFVFVIDDKVYKFTGTFAPVNQILGMLKYGRGDIAPIETLVNTIDAIETGKRGNVFYMSAVGFKPPHKGHIEMIKKAVDKAASHNTNFTIFTGRQPRGEISLEQSIKILKTLLLDQGISFGDNPGQVRVMPSAESNPTGRTYSDTAANRKSGEVGKTIYTTSPMQPLLNAISELPENSTVFIVSSTDDPGRGASMRKSVQGFRPDVELFDYTVDITPAVEGEGKLSATDMRKAIADHDFERFLRFIPDESLEKADQIWTKILGRESKSQVSETKKKGVDSINHDLLNDMVFAQLSENKEFQGLMELAVVEVEDEDEEDEDEDTVEEASSMAAGSVQVGAGDVRGKRDDKKKKQNTLIREIYDYLANKDIIKELQHEHQ